MKRLTILLLAMAMCLGSVVAAKADGIDIKVKGQWDFVFGYTDKDFTDSSNGGRVRDTRWDDRSVARQRIRTQIDFITSEYLSAVLMFEIGDLRWGGGSSKNGRGSGGDLDADGVNIETKRAYLDWIVPYTEISVRMGIQYLALPSCRFSNPIFGADVAAITVSAPVTDWLSAVVFWARPFDQYYNDDDGFSNRDLNDEVDIFGLVLPMSFNEIGLSFAPYFVYSWVGANSGIYDYVFRGENVNTVSANDSDTKAWWLGANLAFTFFDPLEFNMDFAYGRLNRTDIGGLGRTGLYWDPDAAGGAGAHVRDSAGFAQGTQAMAAGWYLAATLDYKLDFMTPGIFGWYASGDTEGGANQNRIGRMPVVGTDDGFTATSFGTAGYYGIGNGNNTNAVTGTGMGTWGIGIQLADVTFIEDLSHTLRFAYYQGTNDSAVVRNDGNTNGGWLKYGADALYLTDKDQVFEINFDHKYQIYENLTMVLELGYIHLSSDEDTWRTGNTDFDDTDNAWKAEINFRYSF
ncbi:outer membrane homotrimeric porin [Desulfovibrio sp. OttesenSCG-928-G11]|nr:outer membrane homotrimeric porin [Desulfovibrio sp. OttesenSCG-928-G11]